MDTKKPVVAILGALLAVAIGVIVFLVASSQPKPQTDTVPVPDVVRLEEDDARKLITNVGLKVGDEDEQNSDNIPAGQIISQDPAASTVVDKGTAVKLVISKGKADAPQTTVPDLSGMSQEDAEKALTDAKLVPVPGSPTYSDNVDPGKVCSQSVPAGTKLAEESQVVFKISLGKETVAVPDVTGKTIDDARDALNKAGLGTDTTSSYSNTVDKDKVISQSVAKDTKVVKGTVVTLEVSLGAKPTSQVAVPNIYTYSLDDAKRALESAGLNYRYTGDDDGTVVDVDPDTGTMVDVGSTVSFTLQHHVTLVAVPDVSGMSGSDARSECEQAGLELNYDEDNPDKAIDSTDPVAGTMVDVGSEVDAIYAPDPEPEPPVGGWQVDTQQGSAVSSAEAAIFRGLKPQSDSSDDSGNSDDSGDDTSDATALSTANDSSDDASDDTSGSAFDTSGYTPVAVVATQVVSGTNYAFLAHSDSAWYVFEISTDTSGNPSLISQNSIDVTNIATGDASAQVPGGWSASEAESTALASSDAQSAFDDASSQWVGVSLKPLALLAKQVTDGMNYKVLCAGAPTTQNPTEQLYIATIHVDTDGNASFTDVSTFDLASYLG